MLVLVGLKEENRRVLSHRRLVFLTRDAVGEQGERTGLLLQQCEFLRFGGVGTEEDDIFISILPDDIDQK